MITGIHQPNFMPWIGYFKKIQKSDVFVFLDDVKCSKNSYFNRNKFSSSKKFEDCFWLTCPLSSKSYSKNINEVISSNLFFKKHVNFFKMRYSKTKEKQLLEEVIQIYEKNCKENSLNICELNMTFVKLICEYLEINAEFSRSSLIGLQEFRKQDKVIKIVKKLGGDVYISGSGAISYQNSNDFKNEGIELRYLNFTVPEEFKIKNDNLSILDIMLHEGICKTKKTILH